MQNSKDYISELMKYCDPLSILALGVDGQLIRLYCPFSVQVLQPIGELVRGDVHIVQAVKLTQDISEVYLIGGKAYYLKYFKILL
jgi:hypothetical protein